MLWPISKQPAQPPKTVSFPTCTAISLFTRQSPALQKRAIRALLCAFSRPLCEITLSETNRTLSLRWWKQKHPICTNWCGGPERGGKKMWIRTSYLVLRIFRNCKISENCISLRALKNLKPGKRNEIETHYSHCVVLMFTLSRLIYSCQGRRDLKFLQTIKPSCTLVIVLHSDSWLV